jgi:hypothetical protein
MKTLLSIIAFFFIWIIAFNVGKAEGIKQNEARYQKKVDAICEAWPWPKPWPCALEEDPHAGS